MIPARNHRVRQILENRAAIVVDEARLPMEDASRGAHLGAVGGPNPLVAQAHAECRRRRAQFAEDVRTHTKVPRIRGMAGTGERTIASGARDRISPCVTLWFRCTTGSAPSSPIAWYRLYTNES